MIGLIDRERVDQELYDDFETAKAREVCELRLLLLLQVLVQAQLSKWLLMFMSVVKPTHGSFFILIFSEYCLAKFLSELA